MLGENEEVDTKQMVLERRGSFCIHLENKRERDGVRR